MTDAIVQNQWWQSLGNNLPEAFLADQRAMEKARLSALLEVTEPKGDKPDWVYRIRRAADLIELIALDNPAGTHRFSELAALIYEALGVVDSGNIEHHWLLSALIWQLSNSQSISAILASRLMSGETFASRDIVEVLATAFSARNFDALAELSEAAISRGGSLRKQALERLNWSDAIEAGVLLSAGIVMQELARYVKFEVDEPPRLDDFVDLRNLILASGNGRRFKIGRLMAECVRKFVAASSRITIGRLPNLSSPAKQRINFYLRAYSELWPSQIAAIEAGLLDSARQHFVVSAPTSSGKTLCGELAIIQELTDKPDSMCFYVVPTRALVAEKGHELSGKLGRQLGYRVRSATSALQQDEIEGSLLSDAQIVVCTPEKLDLLIRHQDASVERASLFVIDETQMVADDDRGLGLEFVVIKILLIKPDSRIILLSAMLPNAEEFGRWLSRQAIVSPSDWRPTRQKFGTLVFEQLKPRGSRLNLAFFDPAGQPQSVQLLLQQYSRQPKTLLEGISWTVAALRVKGPVLVFCMTKSRCEEVVQEIVDHSAATGVQYALTPRIKALRTKVRREIGPDFLLEQALAYRVAYHHADLPSRIRVDLENLIANGDVDVVASTTTLAEGVNLPISTVIFEDWITHVDPRTGIEPSPLDLAKFRNIAGRAGRAGKETEGLVLFFEPARPNKQIKTDDGKAISPLQYYLRHTYPPIIGRFLEIVTSYKVPDEASLENAWEAGDLVWRPEVRHALRQFGTAVLHAMEVLKLDNDDAVIDSVVDRSLLVVQAPDRRELARDWMKVWVKHYRGVKLDRDELRPIAMQVGLPLSALQRLYRNLISAPDLLEKFRGTVNDPLRLSEDQIATATTVVASIRELEWDPNTVPHARLLRAWISGAPVNDLVSIYAPNITERTRLVERTCNYATRSLSGYGAWGMYALARTLELVLGEENVAPITKRLPLLTYFGVDNTPAAILSLLDIERIDALRLGRAFLAEGQTDISISGIRNWAQTLTVDKLTSMLRGGDNREIDSHTLAALGVKQAA